MATSDEAVPAADTLLEAVDMRPLMASFPSGVVVTTTMHSDGTPWGMTCTSLCSVTLDPPTLLVCLRRGSPTLDALTDSGWFTVNLLHDRARPTAELFSSGQADRFEKVRWRLGDVPAGPHLLDAAHTVADCEIADATVVGTHAVVLGRVRAITRLRAVRPLLYGLRQYSTWADAVEGAYLSSDAQGFDWS